jgi:Ca2+-binding RTX toxin-like protein
MNTMLESLESRRLLSGVTLITHGQGGSAGGDVARIADLIAERAGGAAQYVMTVADKDGDVVVTSFTRDADSQDIKQVSTGEMIIRLDWSDLKTTATPQIASAAADYMLANGLVEQQIHLAGPSRGASVVSNLAAALGERGVWIDQVTYIDPVPVEIPLVGDGPMRVTDNIVFADDYWRSDNNIATGFDGQPVDGAHNVSLNNTVQIDNDGDPHVGAGAYYVSTVDPTAPIVSPAKASWFKGTADAPARDKTGYYFSRIAGGARPADGVSAAFGGSASRDGVDRSGTQWANVSDVTLIGGEFTVAAGKTIRVGLRYGDADTAMTVSVYLDRDQNPYNGNTVTRIARRSLAKAAMGGVRVSGTTVEADPGTYFVYAQIADKAGHVRYAYNRTALKLTSPSASLKFASNVSGEIRANGTSGNDRIYATTNGTSVAITRDDFTQILSLTGVRGMVIDGGAGDDSLVLGSGVMGSVLLGGDGNDTLIGADNNDSIIGGTGKDRLYGGGGDDRLSGAGGNDFLEGGSGSDRLYGDAGNDIILAGSGNDRIWGGSGSDTVNGGTGTGTDRSENDPLDDLNDIEVLWAL